jgi:hypothetical protein
MSPHNILLLLALLFLLIGVWLSLHSKFSHTPLVSGGTPLSPPPPSQACAGYLCHPSA